MTWILILTMYGGNMGGHSAIHSVSFRLENQCMQAGDLWLKNNRRAYGKASAICVPNGV